MVTTAAGKQSIRVSLDPVRRLPVSDPDDIARCISLRCVTENIIITAAFYGFSTDVEYSASSTSSDSSALIRFERTRADDSKAELIPCMALRRCSRCTFGRARINSGDLKKLANAARQKGVDYEFHTQQRSIESVAEVVLTGRRDPVPADPFAAGLFSWTRFNAREAERRRDGLLFTQMGYPPMPRCVGRVLVSALVKRDVHKARSWRLARSSAALMIFAPTAQDHVHWFSVGRSFQRVVLTAASRRIRYAHLQLPYTRPASAADLRSCFDCGEHGFLIVRLGYSARVPNSPRRSIHRLIFEDQDEGSNTQDE
jgi:hypothetical protein